MQNTFTATFRVSRQQLADLTGVCEKTARKEYKTIMDCLQIVGRKHLTYQDLADFGIIKFSNLK